MNRHMAANTFAAGLESQAAVRHLRLRVKSGVALQAELAAFAPHQKHAVGASVRIVAGDAPSTFTAGCSKTNGPRFSTWQFTQVSDPGLFRLAMFTVP